MAKAQAPAPEEVPEGGAWAKVTIVKGFTLTHDKATFPDEPNMWGKEEYIPPGVHDFPASIADHWFVKAHSDNPPAVSPAHGTPEYAHAEQARAARRKLVEAAIEQQAAEAAFQVKQEAVLTGAVGQAEEDAHAVFVAQSDEQAKQAALNEAARTGAKVALPQRRVPPPT